MSKRDSNNSKKKEFGNKLYAVWHSMIQRCINKNVKSYKDYGGRGILVCEEWFLDFSVFYEWAISNGYREGLSLDRKDTDGNYEPSNCRWATRFEQDINKTNNTIIEIDGIKKTLAEWAKESGIGRTTIMARYKLGIRGKDLLNKPKKLGKLTEEQVLEIDKLLEEGKMKQKDIAELYGVGNTAIYNIREGIKWSRITGRKKV